MNSMGIAGGKNLLPEGGEAFLISNFLSSEAAHTFFEQIQSEVSWQSREILLFGKKILQPRLVAWQGDPECAYRYSGVTWVPEPWTPAVSDLRARISRFLDEPFNGVLLNWYRNGRDSMGWHSDDEPELGAEPVIASLSLGVSRRFVFRKKKNAKEKIELELNSGSLLVMRGKAQEQWQHALPRSARIDGGRINLTYRRILDR